MLDEAARRKGYGDTASDYQGVGAWVAPANPGYENDAERRADVEDNAPDVNIEDIALGYSLVDEKYWQEPRKYMQTDATAIESVNAIREAIAAVRRGEKNVKVKVYRAVPTSVKEGKLRNGDWVTPSKDYAKMHGEHRLEGKYRIIEDEVSVNELWWDGNDSREWGFDNGKGYKYKNVKNNRKSDDLVTRDDKGNVIPPSKRFNQRKADERYQKAGTPLTPNSAEVALRDAIADLMRKSGLDVIDHEDGQQVLDIANGRGTRLSAKQKRALETVTIADESTNNATAISSADGAKIQKNLESLAEGYSNRSNKSKGFITDLSQSLNLEQHEASHYGTFVTENGKTVTIRVSNHNARVSNFDRNGEIDGISIVISSHGNKGLNNDGNAHIVEFFYSKQSLERSEGKPLADIIRSVSTALKNGEFKDNTGLAQRQEVNEQTIREHRVYHGSGADFDHFDHSHMGEGEGAQVYGWGTYVTEVKGIGEGYAIRSMNGSSMSHDELSLKRSELEYYIASAKEKLPFLKGEYKAELEAQISEWEEQLKDYEEHNYLYTVEIPDDNGSNYLDWDKNTGVDLVNRIRETLRKNADLKELYDGSELNAELEHLAPKIPFSETYIFLYELLGSDKAASQMLHDMGFTGIKYPADYRQGGRADGAKNYVIFNEEDAKITDRIRFFRTSNGEAYGFTVGGKIYIDPRIATVETPIHEYAHLWATAMREGNPTEWKNIVGLMKGTSVWAEVQKLYPELKNDDDIADEVLATFSGRRGAERLRAEQQKIMQGNGSVFEKAAAVGALARVKQALSKFWKGVADFLGIHYTSAEEVADRVMKDLLEGVDPRKFGGKNDERVRKQFIGEKGAAAADNAEEVSVRLDNLAVAREMEKAGKDAKAIKMATGWERGADGKWRYEIPEGKYFPKGDAEYEKVRKKQSWCKELDLLSDRIFDGEELSAEENKRFEQLADEEAKFKTEYLTREKPYLSDWLKNDELFKSYPELKSVEIVFTDNLLKGASGYYSERESKIVVNTNSTMSTESIIAHEVQHAIQHIEGFARGGNPETVRQQIEDYIGKNEEDVEMTKSVIESAFDLFAKASKLEIIYPKMINSDVEWQRQTATDAYWDALNTIDYSFRNFETEVKNDYSQFKGMSPYEIARTGYHVKETIEELKRMSDEYLNSLTDDDRYLEELVDRYKKALESDSDAVLYTKLSGEVESRNVQARMGMNDEERRASLAAETEDVARED
uniref:LPD23 domain-containing protein n=1 Tax=Alloprevotella sp. TaxID=1872471 RepID=UPI003FEFAEEA